MNQRTASIGRSVAPIRSVLIADAGLADGLIAIDSLSSPQTPVLA